MVVVRPDILATVDADTSPSGLVYGVSSPATNGRLAFVDSPQDSISSFTQEDIDSRTVIFLHDGSKEPGAIYLNVGIRTRFSIFGCLKFSRPMPFQNQEYRTLDFVTDRHPL